MKSLTLILLVAVLSLVPKLYLGTSSAFAKLCFALTGATKLRRQVRSQMEFGNEGIVTLLVFFILGCLTAHAAEIPSLEPVTFHGQTYIIHVVFPQKDDLQLFLNDDQGKPLLDFVALDKYVTSKGEHLLFAANAGMFEPTMKPVGLLVQDGKEISPLNLNDATGNFYMKPNGVFLINEKHEARVIESSEYPTMLTPAMWATQSGPLLVHGGSIHPDFNADSKSVKIRSGVGVRKDGSIVFALSRTPVTFYDFADFFLVKLKCPNALFLDGDISAFYSPDKKDTFPHNFGPMIGTIQKEAKK